MKNTISISMIDIPKPPHTCFQTEKNADTLLFDWAERCGHEQNPRDG